LGSKTGFGEDLGGLLGAFEWSWGHLGGGLGTLGQPWGIFGTMSGILGAMLGPCPGYWGPSWGVLGATLGGLGVDVGGIGGHTGGFWQTLQHMPTQAAPDMHVVRKCAHRNTATLLMCPAHARALKHRNANQPNQRTSPRWKRARRSQDVSGKCANIWFPVSGRTDTGAVSSASNQGAWQTLGCTGSQTRAR